MAHVVVHRIFSLSVSLPVRGADGLAKRAPYGGVERQRLSSQSVKAHLRSATGVPGSMSDLAVELGTDMSVRSALIGPRIIAPELEKRGLKAEVASDWAGAIMALFQSGKKAPETASPKKGKKAKADAETEDAKEDDAGEAAAASLPGRQVLTLGKQEIDALTTVAETLQNEKSLFVESSG
jgi:CRISPR system Cascade subunit CasC